MIKTIKDFPLYSVTDDGRVFGPNGELRGWQNASGYRMVLIINEDGKAQKLVHRLVAEAFIDGRTEGRDVIDHIDGNRTNNHVSNLRWCTQAENMKYAYESNRFPKRQTPIPVILVDTTTGREERFDSIHAAAVAHNLAYWNLSDILHKKSTRKTIHGYTIYPA